MLCGSSCTREIAREREREREREKSRQRDTDTESLRHTGGARAAQIYNTRSK